MATTLSFKNIIDLPVWRPVSPAPTASAAGTSYCYDKRNGERNAPYNYLLASATALWAYLPHNDGFNFLGSPALTGTFGAGATCIFHPTQGPRGTIAAGATTTSVTLSTALPASVTENQLANTGDGEGGFWVRIINNVAGGGQTESRRIIANSSGTTPTLYFDSPFSFTPGTGAAYEFRSGRVFMLSAGTLAAGMWKYYDAATNSFSGNLATTNLPATVGGDSCLVALSEGHIPNDAATGEGFFGLITASASSGTTITATGLPAALATNEYRNFQVRIVTDITTPTAVGQRRRISSHTSGASAVFTVPAWSVTPSSNAVFVIENDDDKILLFTNQTSVYTYNITADTWDTTTFSAAANAGGAGVTAEQSFGITVDDNRLARHSFIYRIRGGASAAIDVLDIAGSATGSWTADIPYGQRGQTFTTGTSGAYDPLTHSGKYMYVQISGSGRYNRFDMKNRYMEAWTTLRFPHGTALVGRKLHLAFFQDGSTKLAALYAQRHTATEQFSILLQR